MLGAKLIEYHAEAIQNCSEQMEEKQRNVLAWENGTKQKALPFSSYLSLQFPLGC